MYFTPTVASLCSSRGAILLPRAPARGDIGLEMRATFKSHYQIWLSCLGCNASWRGQTNTSIIIGDMSLSINTPSVCKGLTHAAFISQLHCPEGLLICIYQDEQSYFKVIKQTCEILAELKVFKEKLPHGFELQKTHSKYNLYTFKLFYMKGVLVILKRLWRFSFSMTEHV